MTSSGDPEVAPPSLDSEVGDASLAPESSPDPQAARSRPAQRAARQRWSEADLALCGERWSRVSEYMVTTIERAVASPSVGGNLSEHRQIEWLFDDLIDMREGHLHSMDERQAFETLYRANVRLVNSYTCARLGRDAGEEVTSDVFHAAVIAYRSGRASEVTPAWLISVARNKVIDRWRAAGRRKARAHLLRPRREDLADFPDDWAHDDRREAVFAALSALTERHRMLLILHHVDGMPIRDISDALGQSDEAVESALARARKSFRRHYRPRTEVA